MWNLWIFVQWNPNSETVSLPFIFYFPPHTGTKFPINCSFVLQKQLNIVNISDICNTSIHHDLHWAWMSCRCKLKQAFNHLKPPICETPKVATPIVGNPERHSGNVSCKDILKDTYKCNYQLITFRHHPTKPGHEVGRVLSAHHWVVPSNKCQFNPWEALDITTLKITTLKI